MAGALDESSNSPALQRRISELQQRLASFELSLRSTPALLCRLRLFVALLASAFDERLSLNIALLGFARFLYAFHKTRSGTSLAQLSAAALEPLFRLERHTVSKQLARYLQSECLVRALLSNVAHLLGRVLLLANHLDNDQHLLPLPFARLLRETLVAFLELKCPLGLQCRVDLFLQIIQSLTRSAHLELQFGSPAAKPKNLVGCLRALSRVCAQFCSFANELNLPARAPALSVSADEYLVVSEQLCLLNAAVLQRVEAETVPALRDDLLHELLCRYLSEVHSWHVQLALGILCVRQLESPSPSSASANANANVARRESIARSLLARVLLAHESLVRFARGGCERDQCCALVMFFRVLFEAYRLCFPKACRKRWTSAAVEADADALLACSAAGHLCANEALRWAFEYAIEDTLGCLLGARVAEDLCWFGEPYWTGSHVADGDLVVRRSRELAAIPFVVTEHRVKENAVCNRIFEYIFS